ncbi:MAG: methyltransferase dimerization domain-containing protein [Xanthobacteraceae bacterium]
MSLAAPTPITPERLLGFTFGFAPPVIIEAGIRLRIFDLLDEGAKTAEQIAAITGASARGLRIVLNALVGLDLLAKEPRGHYSLTSESSAFLVSGKQSFHGAFFLLTSERMLGAWSNLCSVVRNGHPSHRVNQEADGTKFFQQFVEDIFPIHLPAARRLAECFDLTGAIAPLSVLDVAAGSGVWSIAMAKQSPFVQVTAIDWTGIIPITERVTRREGVASQYHFVGGDLLAVDFGSGHSIATLGHILHSEGEERSRRLLKKTFDALAPGGNIAIAEILVDQDRRAPLSALLFAVNMLVNSEQGDTFSLDEIDRWLRDANFDCVRTLDAPGLAPKIVLATKPRCAVGSKS